MNNEDTPKIITKKASKIKFQISNALGGIGKFEILIFVIGLTTIALTLIFLTKVNAIASVVVSLVQFLFYLFLCFPTPTGEKLYTVIWTGIVFIFKNKKFKNNEVEYVSGNMFGFSNIKKGVSFKIKASDLTLATQIERTPILENLSLLLQNIDLDYELKKIDVPYNYNSQKKYLQEQILKTTDNQKLEQLDNQLALIEKLEQGEQTKITHFIIFYGRDFNFINKKIKPVLTNSVDLIFEPSSEEETKLIVQQLICPQKLKDNITNFNAVQHKNYFKAGTKYISYLTINQYPFLVYDGWLSNFNFPEINYSLKCYHLSQQESLKILDTAIKLAEIQDTKKVSENELLKNYLDNFYGLIEHIQQSNSILKMTCLTFTITANSKKELELQKSYLIAELQKQNFLINQLKYYQKQAYENEVNWLNSKNKKQSIFWQEMAPITIASAWPFVPTPLSDERGVIVGTNENDEPVILDVKYRDSNRKSSNILFLGSTGSGKTWTTKKILNWLYVTNTKIFIIDPDREYEKLIDHYQGQIIIIGKKENKINPLEIFSENFNEHLNNLGQWFLSLFNDLTTQDLTYFQELVLLLYNKFKISNTTDISLLKTNDYPILSDLFKIAENKEKTEKYKSRVHSALWMLANGFESGLFNGHTAINLKSDFIVFDTNELPKNIKVLNAIYYLMLSFIDNKIRDNKEKNKLLSETEQNWVCLVVDEAHTMINPNNLLALNFLANLAKRIRKYNGILFTITQNVNDLVGTFEIKTQSQAIINSCSYQFIHRLRGTDIKDFDDLIAPNGRLNQHQISVLTTDNAGLNLFFLNQNRQILQTEITLLEKDIFK